MAYHEIERPQAPSGTPEQQVRQIYRYLYTLAEQLENVINNMAKAREEDNNP